MIATLFFSISTPGSKVDAILEAKKINNPKYDNKLDGILQLQTKNLCIFVLGGVKDLSVTLEVQVLRLNDITVRGGFIPQEMVASLISLKKSLLLSEG